MTTTKQIFRAGRVRRWHANPDLADTDDRIDGHSGRVARIILLLHPNPSVELLRQALIHDDGESVTGDIPKPTKDKLYKFGHDGLNEIECDAVELLWDIQLTCNQFIYRWIKLADLIDAYQWMMHHKPHLKDGNGWPEHLERINELARELGVDMAKVEF